MKGSISHARTAPSPFSCHLWSSAHDAAQAAGALLEAVSMPAEGAQTMGLVDSFWRTLEVTELEARVVALEGR